MLVVPPLAPGRRRRALRTVRLRPASPLTLWMNTVRRQMRRTDMSDLRTPVHGGGAAHVGAPHATPQQLAHATRHSRAPQHARTRTQQY